METVLLVLIELAAAVLAVAKAPVTGFGWNALIFLGVFAAVDIVRDLVKEA